MFVSFPRYSLFSTTIERTSRCLSVSARTSSVVIIARGSGRTGYEALPLRINPDLHRGEFAHRSHPSETEVAPRARRAPNDADVACTRIVEASVRACRGRGRGTCDPYETRRVGSR